MLKIRQLGNIIVNQNNIKTFKDQQFLNQQNKKLAFTKTQIHTVYMINNKQKQDFFKNNRTT